MHDGPKKKVFIPIRFGVTFNVGLNHKKVNNSDVISTFLKILFVLV